MPRFVIIRWPVRNRQSAPEFSNKIKGLPASARKPFFRFGNHRPPSETNLRNLNELLAVIGYIQFLNTEWSCES